LKPFDDRTFRTTITLAFHEKREREKRAAAHADDRIARERLAIEATTDSLTGVWNRRMLVDQIRSEGARAAENGTLFSLLLVDLDTFKPINDRHGHVAGDAVLRFVAQRIQHAVRSYDGIGRYGGDEFLVVMPHADAQVALHVAERIRAAIAESPMAWGEDTLQLSVSIGVAVTDRSVEPIVLVDIADRSLYAAKDAGRNSVGPVLRPGA
jgi:diguanylate cyclase (GGDEF)-like protein